jgi:hypothetical protein
MGSCKGLNWLSYFDPRKDYKWVWWCRGDSTDTGMTTPCRDRGAPRMKCPFKGHYLLTMTAALDLIISSSS